MLVEAASDCSETDGTVQIVGDDISDTVDVVYYEQGDFHTHQVVLE